MDVDKKEGEGGGTGQVQRWPLKWCFISPVSQDHKIMVPSSEPDTIFSLSAWIAFNPPKTVHIEKESERKLNSLWVVGRVESRADYHHSFLMSFKAPFECAVIKSPKIYSQCVSSWYLKGSEEVREARGSLREKVYQIVTLYGKTTLLFWSLKMLDAHLRDFIRMPRLLCSRVSLE